MFFLLILQYVFTNFACRVNCKSQLTKNIEKLAVKVNCEKKIFFTIDFLCIFSYFFTLSSFLGKYILSFVDPEADQALIRILKIMEAKLIFW